MRDLCLDIYQTVNIAIYIQADKSQYFCVEYQFAKISSTNCQNLDKIRKAASI